MKYDKYNHSYDVCSIVHPFEPCEDPQRKIEKKTTKKPLSSCCGAPIYESGNCVQCGKPRNAVAPKNDKKEMDFIQKHLSELGISPAAPKEKEDDLCTKCGYEKESKRCCSCNCHIRADIEIVGVESPAPRPTEEWEERFEKIEKQHECINQTRCSLCKRERKSFIAAELAKKDEEIKTLKQQINGKS